MIGYEGYQDSVKKFVADAIDAYLETGIAEQYLNDSPGVSALTDDEWDEALAFFKRTVREVEVTIR